MGIAENKALVERFCSFYGTQDFRSFRDMLSDDLTWWINGKPHLFAGAGTMTKTQYIDMLRTNGGALEGGMTMTVVGMVAEGDCVAAELRSHAVTKTGKVYSNDYHILFELRDGKIVKVREYLDPMHGLEVFSG
ncbi:nuclear transport factor 2 family protein [Phenylobacterium sp.]|uniref:nuclear transport factor 2 family protein n=1 Tax=Phenylobacterium sp. TaxID=1871053 RepID=UPI002601054E|nr:nuclear transport factor 2 family protein [Phenylobacterium sp.]MBX3486262.1 nuclear transport factor 2 family protein [Phenylobacterium sp.]